MLYLLFRAGKDAYAVPASCVGKVVPLVVLRNCPAAPEYVAGLFNYRGTVTPVIDLSRLLTGTASGPRLSTRILLASYSKPGMTARTIGLMAEEVTHTFAAEEASFTRAGIVADRTPYLGAICCKDGEMIQCIEIEKILPPEMEAMLFPESMDSSAT